MAQAAHSRPTPCAQLLGPSITAHIEATYLDAADKIHALQFALSGGHVQAPWPVQPTTIAAPTAASLDAGPLAPPTPATVRTQRRAIAITGTVLLPVPQGPLVLTALHTVVGPPLQGEGMWTTSGLPHAGSSKMPAVARAFLRPDPARPYALATLLQFDMRVARLHIVAGTDQPGGPIGHRGPGSITAADIQTDHLLATFNGGFKYADGEYGLMSDGTTYVRPVWGVATIAVTRDGRVLMGNWGKDPRLTGANQSLIAWRQNGALLVDQGRVTPHTNDGAAWGISVMNTVYTWRSGIGVTRQGTLLYVGRQLTLGCYAGPDPPCSRRRDGHATGYQSILGTQLHLWP